MILEALVKNTPLTHPDAEDLAKAVVLCKNIADHMNSTLASTRSSEYLAVLGLGHLLEPHRRLIKEGVLQVEHIKYFDTTKQNNIKQHK